MFLFRGNLGRLAYLGYMLLAVACGILVCLALLVVEFILALISEATTFDPRLSAYVSIVVAMTTIAWISLSVTTARIRNAGYPPLPFVGGYMILILLDFFVITQLTDLRFFYPFQDYTPIGGLSSIAFYLIAFCWPPKNEPEKPDLPALPAATAPAAATPRPSRVTFGRRAPSR